jgi:hypothetical protein
MRHDAVDTSVVDLNESQRQLCTWVAEQARVGITRAFYRDVKKATGIRTDTELTQVLRQFRERTDDIHRLAQSPVVNTHTPYFDIHAAAHWIWAGYCQNREQGPELQTISSTANKGCKSSGSANSCATCLF